MLCNNAAPLSFASRLPSALKLRRTSRAAPPNDKEYTNFNLNCHMTMQKRNITNTMGKIYGTGHFNPKSFDRAQRKSRKKLYLWGLGIFLLAISGAVLLGFYLFTKTSEGFTGERVIVQIPEQKNPKIGEEEEYTLQVINNEDVDLENVTIFISFPKPPDSGPALKLISTSIDPENEAGNSWQLGEIKSGQTGALTLRTLFSGQTGDDILVSFNANFSPKGFSSSFSSEGSHLFRIGDPIVALNVDGPSRAAKGSEVRLSIQVQKDEQSDSAMLDSVVSIGYPKTFMSPVFEPALKDGEKNWKLRDLLDADGKYQLFARGTIGEDIGKSVDILVSLSSSEGVALAQKQQSIAVQSSRAKISIEGKPAQGKKLQWGENAAYTVNINNTSEYVMRGMIMSLDIIGEELLKSDSFDIKDGGFYEAGKIIWDETAATKLDSLRPDGSTTLSFTAKTKDSAPNNFSGVPRIALVGQLKGTLGDEEVVIESEELAVNILANIEFDANASWAGGINPPAVGQETTYSIVWKVGPISGDLKDITISAPLPSNVSWLNETDYSIGEISYNQKDRAVEWRASRIPKSDEPFSIKFKVGLTPNSQTGDNSKIIEQSSFQAADAAVGEELELFDYAILLGGV